MSHFLVKKRKFNYPLIFGYCFLFSICLWGNTLHAQTAGQYSKEGEKAYAASDYYTAIYYYTAALKSDSLYVKARYHLAECYAKVNDFPHALEAFSIAKEEDTKNQFPLCEFYIGMMNKSLGNYLPALNHFQQFTSHYKTDDFYAKKAQQELASAEWAIDHSKDSDANNTVVRMDDKINSTSSDFGGTQLNDSLFQFSSLREESGAKDKSLSSHFYFMVKKGNSWRKAESPFPWLDTLKGEVGNGSFSVDKKRFYFTVCEKKNVGELRCDIYQSIYENEAWKTPRKLNDEINPSAFTNTQPWEGRGPNGEAMLFFSSDRPGGKGNLDIWTAAMDANGNFVSPKNIGEPINTAGNEITPFYDANKNELYFSSDWHYGYGGYDIQKSKRIGSTWEQPDNAGKPFNSSYNDFYFNLNEDAHEGYLSSNRKGSLYLTGEACCNDLYAIGMKFTKKDSVPSGLIGRINTQIQTNTHTNIDHHDTASITASVSIPKDTPTTLKELKSMLPVTVYFHNDIPEPASVSDTTSINYQRTYESYSVMRYAYADAFGKETGQKEMAAKEINHFFDEKVDGGMHKLLLFSGILLRELEQGKTVTLTLEGYCSPLAMNDYNIHLAKRRIASLKNYLCAFSDGALWKYVKDGQLQLQNAPFGEEHAAAGISDDRLNTGKSVYDPRAAGERRLAIIDISSGK